MSDTNRPLWEAMDAARFLAFRMGCNNGAAAAAELRAIAKAMAEAEQRGEFTSNGLYGWLLAEADRAEAGD